MRPLAQPQASSRAGHPRSRSQFLLHPFESSKHHPLQAAPCPLSKGEGDGCPTFRPKPGRPGHCQGCVCGGRVGWW